MCANVLRVPAREASRGWHQCFMGLPHHLSGVSFLFGPGFLSFFILLIDDFRNGKQA